jgi:hypothetical protein
MRRLKEDVKMDRRETGVEGVEWLIRFKIGTGGDHFGHGNEPSGFIKGGEFLD